MATLPHPCPIHADEDVVGIQNSDGAFVFTCERSGHPGGDPYNWIQDPIVEEDSGIGGLADELGLDTEMPAAISSLGQGWFEYGLVERAYAQAKPDDFCQMVTRWGHSARGARKFSASAYIAGVMGRLATANIVYLKFGPGTGRWDYNNPISYWSINPDADWEQRTSWSSVLGDGPGDPCAEYVDPC